MNIFPLSEQKMACITLIFHFCHIQVASNSADSLPDEEACLPVIRGILQWFFFDGSPYYTFPVESGQGVRLHYIEPVSSPMPTAVLC